VQGKNIDLGMTTMGVALQAWNGQGDWTKGQKMRDIRALFPMYDTPFHFVALKRSGINSVAQLAGKRVGVGPRAGTPGTYFPLMFQALGLQNVTIRNGQASDMASQLADGLIDCFAFAAGLPIASYSELEATNEVVFFSFTQQEIDKLRQAMPELSPTEIPAGTYKSMTAAQPTVGVFNFAIAHKDLPDSLAYAIVKAVHENHDAMVRGHAAAKETLPENVSKNTFLTFHPGAARYYKERGQNIPANLVG
jgi:TRAP transporter TAXI family solute receptor